MTVGQAKKLKADVIAFGTHRRRGLDHVVLSSDAEAATLEFGWEREEHGFRVRARQPKATR